jgi:DNA-binding NarL/FixJ family response regulator
MPLRLLIADDQPTMRSLLHREMERAGSFEVCGEAVDGADAVAKAERLRPDLIILDLRMPVLNGLEAASIIDKAFPAVPIFLFTLIDGPELRKAAATAGIRQVVPKAEGIKALLAAIKSVMNKENIPDPPLGSERPAPAIVDIDDK